MIAIVLAAGKGTRMKSELPKALHPICGKPMTRYVVDACKGAGVQQCTVVIGHRAEEVSRGLGDDVRYVIQRQQLGTGDACAHGIALLDDADRDVMVLPGDTPLLSPEVLRSLMATHAATGAAATVLTTILEDAGEYGRVVRRNGGAVCRIVEAKDASTEERTIREINTAVYCFDLPLLRKYLKHLTCANVQGEYYLTDVIGLLASDGHEVRALVTDDTRAVQGINNRADLARVAGIVRERILNELMLNGVTVIDPSSTYVDFDVEVGADTILYPQTTLEKGCKIGEGCAIGPCSRLANVQAGNDVAVLFSNVVDSIIGNGTKIGPFANIRPGCRIGRKVRIGDFVEAKNAEVGDFVSMSHLSYLGDAVVGEGTNIGAGTITCNYDGYEKHRTVIGKNVFVGSNVTMVAPVTIGDGALVGAGSVVTADVPGDALAIARSKQLVREGWARRRRERKEADRQVPGDSAK